MAKKPDLSAMKANLRGTIKKKPRVSFIPTGEPEQVVKELANTVANIPVKAIEANPFNPRTDFDEAALQELSASLKVHGLVQPITVRSMASGKYQLISGERRWRASQMAGLEEIPAYVRAVENDQEMLEMALVENIQRENLNPVEVAITYKRLMRECNLTHDDLAQRLGKGRTTITNKMGLLELPPDVVKALRQKEISEGHAKSMKGLDFIEEQLYVLGEIRKNDLSVRATEKLVAGLKEKGNKKAKAKKANPYASEIQKLEDEISAFFGVKVQIQSNDKGKGKVVIPFGNFRKLDDLMNRIK
ncbi:MAG: ParB/RepB/Spo0J family partition protein [Bacteroidota bacterium]